MNLYLKSDGNPSFMCNKKGLNLLLQYENGCKNKSMFIFLLSVFLQEKCCKRVNTTPMPPADQHSNVCLNFANITQWPDVSSPSLALF